MEQKQVREPRTVNHIPVEDLTDAQKKALEWNGKGFDNRTHIICSSTGKLLREQHYRLVVSADEGTYYIRDGKKWSEQGHELNPKPFVEEKDIRPKNDQKLSK